MTVPKKQVFDLTDEELRSVEKSNPEHAKKIKSVLEQSIERLENQLANLQGALNDFTQRSSLLMTIAGLLSFLPSAIGLADEGKYLTNFLTWTFPFLIVAVFCYFFSSMRAQAVLKQFPIIAEGEADELTVLKAWTGSLTVVWRMQLDVYEAVLPWFRLTTVFIYLYLISLVINLYMIVFIGYLDSLNSSLIVVALLLFGYLMFNSRHKKSKKGLTFGPSMGSLSQ